MFDNKKEQVKEVIVLGKTFPSEEERRAYFRGELRKKLPELKKMEGFPIGEDEDIINLSDPPYYTACPNPWLNDFIQQWEEEKNQLQKEGKRKLDFKIDEPYAADVSEGKINPIYNAHTYHTKVPHPAIMRYILFYTQPGDIVYDGFAGTGMTGVAASLCGSPDKTFKQIFEIENPNVNWGRRNAICNDLSPLASNIAANYNSCEDLSRFEKNSLTIIENIESTYGWVYEVYDEKRNQKGYINYVVWSDVFLCRHCGNEIIFYDIAVDKIKRKVKSNFICPHCEDALTKKELEKYFITINDSISGEVKKIQKQVPVLINYISGKKKFEKEFDSNDQIILDKIDNHPIEGFYPRERVFEGHNTNQPKNSHGITHVYDFYTRRNLFILSKFHKYLLKNPLYSLLFTSICSTLTSRLVRYNLGNRGNGILNGTLYISSLNAEANIFKLLKGKLKDIIKAIRLNNNVQLTSVSSASNSGVSSNSIDYIFTDPPFGSNIMYSDLNFIWESWLKVRTNNIEEAIENKFQNKSTLDYQNLMAMCFKEYYRILKPGKWMTVEFSNTSAAVWNGIQTAIQNAGFIIANLAAIDKKQGSFKAVTTPTAVKQDLIISCYKPSIEFENKFNSHLYRNVAAWDFVQEHLQHLPIHLTSGNSTTAIIERSPKILFDRLISFYVQKGLPVPIDARVFQKGLRERFIERDGMFFTNEQVQEYDQKKKEYPEVIQLSLLVSSEQDGVLWLKNLLQDKSLSYQDIQPLWMQALAGVRKGDILPELAVILEENFLKDDTGKWYLPDPENEADLEKLRNKRLLKQFDQYKEEALEPRTKRIKEVRVEALRAGFKQCYQDKDFKTIVMLGDKIRNNLLMEDEVLLQFYDIASSRA
jgi:DNA modification methylase